MALTKARITDSIHERLDFSPKKSAEIIEILLESIKKSLEKNEDVLVSGFGKFCVKEKRARKGRNPATGEDMVLTKRKVVTFTCSRVLRDKIN